MPLPLMQEMYGAEGRLTSLSVMMKEGEDLAELKEKIRPLVDPEQYELLDWKQMMPELDQLIEGDQAGGFFVIGILYLVIAFGVFGTILMMTRERMHEFGILVAIGMKKRLLASVVLMETFLITLIATLAGMAGSLPVILYFKKHPLRLSGELQKVYDRYGIEAVIPFSDKSGIFTEQATVVFILAILLSLYAVRKVMKLNAIEAIRS